MMKTLFLILLVISLVASYFLVLGAQGMPVMNENYYVQAAQTMMSSGDYITPYFNNKVRPYKPILTYWLISLFSLFGLSVFSVRLPFALVALAIPLMLYFTLQKNSGKKLASYTALICLTIPVQFFLARIAMPEILLIALISASLLMFYHILLHKKNTLYTLSYYALSGFSVLVKGPISLFFIFSISFAVLISEKSKEQWMKFFSLPGILLCGIIASSWYFVLFYIHGWSVFAASLPIPNMQVSLFSAVFLVYLSFFIFAFFPWGIYSLFTFSSPIRKCETNDTVVLLKKISLFWIIIVFTFFAFYRYKRIYYLALMSPPVAVLAACFLCSISLNNENNTLSYLLKKITGVILVFYLLFNALLFVFYKKMLLHSPSPFLLAFPCTAICFSFMLLFFLIRKWKPSNSLYIFSLFFLLMFPPFITELSNKDIYNFSLRFIEFRNNLNKNVPLYFYRLSHQQLFLEPTKQAQSIRKPEKLKKLFKKNAPALVVIRESDAQDVIFKENLTYDIIATNLRWGPPRNKRNNFTWKDVFTREKITEPVYLLEKK